MTPREAFRLQAGFCAGMGSPFTARLCSLLADRLARGGSYVWADQTARMARMSAAIAIARAKQVRVEGADAADWLALRLGAPRAGRADLHGSWVRWSGWS